MTLILPAIVAELCLGVPGQPKADLLHRNNTNRRVPPLDPSRGGGAPLLEGGGPHDRHLSSICPTRPVLL